MAFIQTCLNKNNWSRTPPNCLSTHTGPWGEDVMVISPRCLEATGKVPILLLMLPLLRATDESCSSSVRQETAWAWGRCATCRISPIPCLFGWHPLSGVVMSQEAASVVVCRIPTLCVYVLYVKAHHWERGFLNSSTVNILSWIFFILEDGPMHCRMF